MRPELRAILDGLLEASADSRVLTLDAIGEAIGVRAITPDEIDTMIAELEGQGRRVTSPDGGRGEAHLKAVVTTARALGPELGRKPTAKEIADRSGLSLLEVHHALALVRVMQR